MLTDVRKMLGRVAKLAGWERGEIRTKMFRHTYATARLQTLDRSQPVSEYTVARELGHNNPAMLRKTYAHLGDVRHRAPVVEYRAEQHRERLGERLAALHCGHHCDHTPSTHQSQQGYQRANPL